MKGGAEVGPVAGGDGGSWVHGGRGVAYGLGGGGGVGGGGVLFSDLYRVNAPVSKSRRLRVFLIILIPGRALLQRFRVAGIRAVWSDLYRGIPRL